MIQRIQTLWLFLATLFNGLLFLFHLHGFAPLAAYAGGSRGVAGDDFWLRVTASWLATHGTPSDPAWHPYPTSIRLISWCAALSARLFEGQPDLEERVAHEVVRQARYLSRAVEHDVGGNHVLKNAVALVVAGRTVGDRRGAGRGPARRH